MCLNVTGSQSEEHVAGTSLITPVQLIAWVGCSQPVCGDVEALGI